MAFGLATPSLSPDVIDAIRRRRVPTDSVDDIQDQPPSEIQDFGGDTRPRMVGAPQQQQIIPAFTRGNDISNPASDVSNIEYEPPAPIQTQSGVGVFQRPQGVSIAQPQAPPAVHQHDLRRTDTGIVQPDVATYDSGTDARGKHIGRLSRFGHGFVEGASQGGGILPGVFGGLLGLLAPSVGNRAVFNADNARFQNEQHKEMGLERANTGYQNQLDVKKQQDELPARKELYSFQQQEQEDRQVNVEKLRQQGQQKKAQLVADAALERAKLNNKTKKDLADTNNLAKATLDLRKIAAGFGGQQWYEGLSDTDKAQAVSDEWQRQRDLQDDFKEAKTNQIEAQTDATKALKTLRDKQGIAIDDKIANPQKYYRGMTGNELYRAQVDDYNGALKHIEKEESQLYADRRAGIVKKPGEFEAKLADIQARRKAAQEAKSTAAKQIISQDAERTRDAQTKKPAASKPPAGKIPIFNSDGTFTGRYK